MIQPPTPQTVKQLRDAVETLLYTQNVPALALREEVQRIANTLRRANTPRARAIAKAIDLALSQAGAGGPGLASVYLFASRVHIGML